jgi:hypothetical protein
MFSLSKCQTFSVGFKSITFRLDELNTEYLKLLIIEKKSKGLEHFNFL